MLIERNLYSPLRTQIEKIINNNAENAKLVSVIDKDRPNKQKRDKDTENRESKPENEHSLDLNADSTEEVRKLDLIA